MTETIYSLGFDTRGVRDWGSAIVLHGHDFPAHMSEGYFTSKGKWIKPHRIEAGSVRECQDWRKTCRAFARVYGFCVACFCDDTVVTFALTQSGRVKESKRHAAKIDWLADRKAA